MLHIACHIEALQVWKSCNRTRKVTLAIRCQYMVHSDQS